MVSIVSFIVISFLFINLYVDVDVTDTTIVAVLVFVVLVVFDVERASALHGVEVVHQLVRVYTATESAYTRN